ncbi:acetylornithine aminotransferase apoenzyme [Carboxydocella sporoproducens DSM 16521]|uniref:Acetylornithine aminotransferase n=2 Tax=Carboxydocella TaxID=178898 RepID=A0A1T4R2C5_9FIRM|nr:MULTISPECIES: acetylornithine transaminase [Carboxydocella]AVX21757.1 acetylornithine/N-succinyldiaminopimelate aminotransferase [Carboxydocella thermautotrophica]SKA10099.1 acetylornithine aminotransferase apoenzyme [Carboxydocella sporoproducens DSM 16521]
MNKTDELIALGKQYVMNTYGRLNLVLAQGQGARVWDLEGKEYLDFLAGIAVNALGHSHPAVVEALKKQAEKLIHCSNLYWIEPQIRLAQLLVENSCGDKVFFCNSGAEANEGAIKLARKYAKLHYGPEKYEIITAINSFHGRTLAAITATGQPKYQKGFEPLVPGFKHVPYNDLQALAEAIGPQTCAIMLEPIQGEGGVVTPDPAYLSGVAQLCREHGLLLILDEVQTGIGRTGKLFAYEHFGIEPDIFTLAKGLGGGVPIGAIVAKEEVAAAFQPGDHASTFGGNPLVCAAALATLNIILEEGFLAQVQVKGEYLRSLLAEMGPVRGKGLMLGLELPGPGAEVVARCQERGLLINCTAGNVLRFVPPLIVNEAEIQEAVRILRDCMK